MEDVYRIKYSAGCSAVSETHEEEMGQSFCFSLKHLVSMATSEQLKVQRSNRLNLFRRKIKETVKLALVISLFCFWMRIISSSKKTLKAIHFG